MTCYGILIRFSLPGTQRRDNDTVNKVTFFLREFENREKWLKWFELDSGEMAFFGFRDLRKIELMNWSVLPL